jgi:hypothetical protein
MLGEEEAKGRSPGSTSNECVAETIDELGQSTPSDWVPVLRAGQTLRISPENVAVGRAGDAVPVSIEATVPPR